MSCLRLSPRVVYPFAFVVGGVSFSLLLYLHPLIIDSASKRLFLVDGSVIALIVGSWGFLGCSVKNALRSPATLWIFCFFISLVLLGLLQGLSSADISTEDVYRELRIMFYFVAMTLLWISRDVSPDSVYERRGPVLLVVILAASVVGTFLFIIIGKALAPTPEIYNEFVAAYGAGGRGLSLAAQLKFKLTPYAVGILQCWLICQLFLVEKRQRVPVYWIVQLLLILAYVTLQSNMRSALGAYLLATAVPFFYAIKRHSTFRRTVARLLLLLPFIAVMMTIFTSVYGDVFVNERFVAQIVDRGVDSVDVLERAVTLMGIFDFSLRGEFSPLGEGLGASLTEPIWRRVMNPIDSAVFNVYLSLGVVAVLVYIALMVSLLINSSTLWVVKRTRPGNVMAADVSVIVGTLVFIGNNFNDSHFLFLPDAAIAGMLIGYITACSPFRFGSTRAAYRVNAQGNNSLGNMQ